MYTKVLPEMTVNPNWIYMGVAAFMGHPAAAGALFAAGIPLGGSLGPLRFDRSKHLRLSEIEERNGTLKIGFAKIRAELGMANRNARRPISFGENLAAEFLAVQMPSGVWEWGLAKEQEANVRRLAWTRQIEKPGARSEAETAGSPAKKGAAAPGRKVVVPSATEARKAVSDYVQVIARGGDNPLMAKSVQGFIAKTLPGDGQGSLFHLADMYGNPIYIPLPNVAAGTSLACRPVRSPRSGRVYFVLVTENRSVPAVARISMGPGYVDVVDTARSINDIENSDAVGRAEVADFVEALARGSPAGRRTNDIKRIKLKMSGTRYQGGVRLTFGNPLGEPLFADLEGADPNSSFDITFEGGETTPLRMHIQDLRGHSWDRDFSPQSPYLGASSPPWEDPGETAIPGGGSAKVGKKGNGHGDPPRSLTPRDITLMIEDELRELLDDKYLVSVTNRYGVELMDFLWGVLSARLKNAIKDKEFFKNLFDITNIRVIEEEVEEETEPELLGVGPTDHGQKGKPRVLEDEPRDEGEIEALGARMQERIERAEREARLQEGFNMAIIEAMKTSARETLRQMEENYLYRTADRTRPGEEVAREAVDMLKRSIADEKLKILRESRQDLLKEIQEAVDLPKKLHAAGIRRTVDGRPFQPRLYQLMDILRIIRDKRKANGNLMGMGKTFEIIAAFLLSGEKEFFISGPKRALDAWMRDFGRYTDISLDAYILADSPDQPEFAANSKINKYRRDTTEERIECLFNVEPDTKDPFRGKGRPDMGRKRVVMMNYELMPKVDQYRQDHGSPQLKFPFVALDEAHQLRTQGGATSSSVYGGDSPESGIEGKYKVPASGTFVEGGPEDLLPLLKWLCRGGTSEVEKYFAETPYEELRKRVGQADLHMFGLIHSALKMMMLRHPKELVLAGLPQRQRLVVHVNMRAGTLQINGGKPIDLVQWLGRSRAWPEQARLYELALRHPQLFEQLYGKKVPLPTEEEEGVPEPVDNATGNGNGNGHGSVNPKLHRPTRLSQIGAGVFNDKEESIKFAAIAYLLENVFKNESSLIFSRYVPPIGNLQAYLAEHTQGRKIEVLHGAVTDTADDRKRSNIIDRFQAGELTDIIGQTDVIGESFDATQATVGLWLNEELLDSTKEQGIGRYYRPDTKRFTPDKVVTTVDIYIDHPHSVDVGYAKRRLWRARIAQLFLESRFSKEILNAINTKYTRILELLSREEEQKDVKPYMFPNEHETNLLQLLRLKLGQIRSATNPETLRRLLDELADIYAQVCLYKSSFFANRAGIKVLSQMFPNKTWRMVDVGAGTSQGFQATMAEEKSLPPGFKLIWTDHDISERMLRFGVFREGKQVVGSMDQLAEAYPPGSQDGFWFSYSWRYANDPLKMVLQMREILPVGGVIVILLPPRNKFTGDDDPEELGMKRGFEQLGLKPINEGKEVLLSDMEPEDYDVLVKLHGKYMADEIRAQAKGKFTALLVEKQKEGTGPPYLKGITSKTFRILQEPRRHAGEEILKGLENNPGSLRLFPDEFAVKAELVDSGERVPMESTLNLRRILKPYHRLILQISRLAEDHHNLIARYGEHKVRAQLAQMDREINNQFDELDGLINDPRMMLTAPARAKLLNDLRRLKDRPIARVFLRRDLRVDAMIAKVEGRSGAKGNSQKKNPGPPLMTPRTEMIIDRASALRGLARPSQWKKAWLAAHMEKELTHHWRLWWTEHKRSSTLEKRLTQLGLIGIWAGTLVIPGAIITGILLLAPWLPGIKWLVGVLSAGLAWTTTRRWANIATHGLINTAWVLIRTIGVALSGSMQTITPQVLAGGLLLLASESVGGEISESHHPGSPALDEFLWAFPPLQGSEEQQRRVIMDTGADMEWIAMAAGDVFQELAFGQHSRVLEVGSGSNVMSGAAALTGGQALIVEQNEDGRWEEVRKALEWPSEDMLSEDEAVAAGILYPRFRDVLSEKSARLLNAWNQAGGSVKSVEADILSEEASGAIDQFAQRHGPINTILATHVVGTDHPSSIRVISDPAQRKAFFKKLAGWADPAGTIFYLSFSVQEIVEVWPLFEEFEAALLSAQLHIDAVAPASVPSELGKVVGVIYRVSRSTKESYLSAKNALAHLIDEYSEPYFEQPDDHLSGLVSRDA